MNRRSGMARPLGVRGHQKETHLISGNKVTKYCPVDGPNEGNHLLALDLDPRTVLITPQPFTVRLDIKQKFRTKAEAQRAEPRIRWTSVDGHKPLERVYTPDFQVDCTTPVPLVIEAKSQREIERIKALLVRREEVMNHLGFHYLVVPNEDINQKGLRVNLVHLRDACKFRKENNARPYIESLQNLLDNRQEHFHWGEFKGKVSDLTLYLGLVCGVVACDLRSGPFSANTKLWQCHGDLSHLQLLNWGV